MKKNFTRRLLLILCGLVSPKSAFCFDYSQTSFREEEAKQQQLTQYKNCFKTIVLKRFQENMNPEKWTLVVDNKEPQEYVYYPLTLQVEQGAKPDFGIFVPQLFYSSFYHLINNTIKTRNIKMLDDELVNWVMQAPPLQLTNQHIGSFTIRMRHVRDESTVIFLGHRLSVLDEIKTSKEGHFALKDQEHVAKTLFVDEIVKRFQKGCDTQPFFIEVDGQTISYQFYPLHLAPLKTSKKSFLGFSPADEILINETKSGPFQLPRLYKDPLKITNFDKMVIKTEEDDTLGVFIPSEIYSEFLNYFDNQTSLLNEITKNWNIYEKLSSDLKRIHLSAQHKKRKDLVLFLCPLENIFIK